MLGEFNTAITDYAAKWKVLVETRKNRQFFTSLRPTAIAWKTVNRAEYDSILTELHELSDIVVENWWDGRWIATLHLRDTKLAEGIEVVKLMQRRPHSTDAIGIDHIDFYSPEVVSANQILKYELNLRWSHEAGGPTKWISIWFADTEAKLRTHTVIDSCARDLSAINERIKNTSSSDVNLATHEQLDPKQ